MPAVRSQQPAGDANAGDRAREAFSQAGLALRSMAYTGGLHLAAGIAVARVYGPSGSGLVAYASIAVVGVIAIADGLNAAIARQTAQLRATDRAAVSAALRIIGIWSTCIALTLIALGLFVHGQRSLMYVGIVVPFALYVRAMGGFDRVALRATRAHVGPTAVNAGAAFVILVAVLAIRPPIDAVMIIWTTGYVLAAGVVWIRLRCIGHAAHSDRTPITIPPRSAIAASLASLMMFLASRADIVIIATATSAAALGNYTLALACGELMWQLGRTISWSTHGRIATVSFARAAKLTAKITAIVLVIEVTIGLTVFVVGPTSLRFIYGGAFADAGPLLQILIPGMTLAVPDSILGYFIRVKADRPAIVRRVEWATFILCAVGSLASVKAVGSIGPAVAATVASLASFIFKAVLFSRLTGLSVASLLKIKARSSHEDRRLAPRGSRGDRRLEERSGPAAV